MLQLVVMMERLVFKHCILHCILYITKSFLHIKIEEERKDWDFWSFFLHDQY